MYIKSIVLDNIRSFNKLVWRIPEEKCPGGWHVILGDNGSGKSTFLRAISLALVGPNTAQALRLNWNDWLKRGEVKGRIRLELCPDKEEDIIIYSNKKIRDNFLPVEVMFSRNEDEVDIDTPSQTKFDSYRYLWKGKSGWFSAAYGPFRRFTGGDADYDRLINQSPRLAAHISIFGENIALTESLRWLKDLKFKKLESDREGQLLPRIQKFINQTDFLPHNVQLKNVSSKDVEFVDGNGCLLPVENLSDGYRSMLSMIFELIRQIASVYGPENIFDPDASFVEVPGVVLVDEIDAHLHPTWQKQVGLWFRKYFPNIQFIVSTHSALVCQAADVGSVFALPKPGSLETGRMVSGDELNRLLYGDIMEAYSTELFGQDVYRSDAAKEQLMRLAELNQKELHKTLTKAEQSEQHSLRKVFPTANTISSQDKIR